MKDTLRRLIVWLITLEARAVLKKYHPKVIVITGSVGKTSTKDAVYRALSGRFFVRRSEKSYNSDVGVPLTVLGVPNGWSSPLRWARNILEGAILLILKAPYPEWLVVEVGADRPGDISRSLSWLRPSIVVATRFPDIPVHVEFYAAPEDVVAEELAPVLWLSLGGALVVNADDPRAKDIEIPAGVERFSFGFDKNADVAGSGFRASSADRMPSGISFSVSTSSAKAHVSIPRVVGKAHAYAALAGIAVAVKLGMPLSEAAKAASLYEPPPGRLRLVRGIQDTVLIDDSYNASPVATEEALGALCNIPRRGRRIAVLADMLELGVFSASEHRRVGKIASKSVDLLITVGVRGRGIAQGAREDGMPPESIHESEQGTEVASYLTSILAPGDVVLIKGSQSMRMERVTKALMEKPNDAKKLLPRQDAEWLNR